MKLSTATLALLVALTSQAAIASNGMLDEAPAAQSPSQQEDHSSTILPPQEQPVTSAEVTPAQQASQWRTDSLQPKGTPDNCELHIWPAERMGSLTTGLLGGGLLDAALHSGRDATNKTLMASALDSPSQIDALLSLDLRNMLSRTSGATIIVHDTPLERKTMNSVKNRRSDSKAQCYSELIVADVMYMKSTIYGRSLRTMFMVRDFGNDQKIDKEYKAWGGNGLKLFPPKEGEDAIAALDELVSVFKGNFEEYARKARVALVTTKTTR